MTDLYSVLGVHPSASPDEVKLAFKRLAKTWHPDRHPTDSVNATARFQEVAAAYEVLGNAAKRAEYDGAAGADGIVSQATVDARAAQTDTGGPCPVCGGKGEVRTPDLSKAGRILFWSNKPCPKGCKAKPMRG
jgi:curved DNA-binding protein CbpA